MTLKEKFANLELDDPYIFMCESDAEQCEKIAEEFAIGFAEWVIYGHITLFRDNPEQLLEIYKKEKGL
jgi:hypothetical protein